MSENKKSNKFPIWHVIAFVLALYAVSVFLLTPNATKINYNDFQALLQAGAVQEVTLGDHEITAIVNPDRLESSLLSKEKINQITKPGNAQFHITTGMVNDPALVSQLKEKNIILNENEPNQWIASIKSWLIPFILFFVAWIFLMRLANPAHNVMGMEKSKAKVYLVSQTNITFKDVAGIDQAKKELKEIVDFLKNPAYFRRLGAHIPRGILLLGAPGTGKTLLARAVAGEAGVPFLSINGSEFVELFVGVGAARVRNLFEQARRNAPSILFIDEIDALGRARSHFSLGGNDEKEQTLNQLLSEMDGFDPTANVIILAATNRPEILDPALLRSGRFDRQVVLDLPDKIARVQILMVHLRKVMHEKDLDIEKIALMTPGFSGADLSTLVNEATLCATHRNAKFVNNDDFTKSIERIIIGIEINHRVLNANDRRFTAYHEMGHALVGAILLGKNPIQKVSIIPRGIKALGYTIQLPTEDRYLMTQEELQIKLTILLAGRAAEKLMFNHISTGSSDDLAKATNIAHNMVMQYGMDETLGSVAYDQIRQSFLNTPSSMDSHSREFSEKTAQLIDQAVLRLTKKAFDDAMTILEKNREIFIKGSELLLKNETLDEKELSELFDR